MKNFIFLFSILILLLVFHNDTIIGAKQGLLLWYQSLVPSLLPFILITNALSETNSYQTLAYFLHKYFPNKTYELIAISFGNLCGYPIGAKIIDDFVKNQFLSIGSANMILAFSSQVSPMFLIGYVYPQMIGKTLPLSIFLISIYLPILLLYPFLNNNSSIKKQDTTNHNQSFQIIDSFYQSVQIIMNIGIYIMIFSILLHILNNYCKGTLINVFLSFLEITTGLNKLKVLPMAQSLKIPIICALCAFGGICSIYQIKCVLSYKNINIKKYLVNKIIFATGTFFIIYIYLLVNNF